MPVSRGAGRSRQMEGGVQCLVGRAESQGTESGRVVVEAEAVRLLWPAVGCLEGSR
jgi:hypothetical protein